ncbi:MAG: zinc-ribbon domain-containing protein [Candidatus Nitrosotenuis sp.]|nr:zinc-ribbon domain-containing protein [Candidatus Nitrosotenuis sp.]
MTFCSKCGGELQENSVYCTKCGLKVGDSMHKRSRWWYLLPILFSIVGGVISYFIVKENDPRLAKNCLILGAILTIIGIAIGVISAATSAYFWHMGF